MSIRQFLLYLGMAAWLVFLWVALVSWSQAPIVVVALAWVASPVPMLVLRVTLEEGRPKGLFSLRTQSLAFLIGDTLWLPLALGAASAGYHLVPADGNFSSSWYLALCIAIGVIAGVMFHFKMDAPAYKKAGWSEALLSPTKVAHDFVAYPFLFGGLLYIGLPVALNHFQWLGALSLSGVLLWALMAALDVVGQPLPRHLHPKWDPKGFHTI